MSNSKAWLGVGLLVPALLACGLKWSSDVTFSVDKQTVRVGEPVEVSFSALKGGDSRRYWLGIVPEVTPLEDYSGCTEIAPETRRATLTPSTAGPHEVRVYSDRSGPVAIVSRSKVNVLP